VTLGRSDPSSPSLVEVEVTEPAVVLDVLLAVQRIDPTLGFRYSCRVAMCGTCAVRVDGRPVLACQCKLPEADSLVVEPLAGLPVVRDLVVDSTPFWEAWRRTEPWFTPRSDGERPVLAAGDADRKLIESGLECVGCGCCWTACDVVASHRSYLGPAALNRTMALVADPRDGRRPERLRMIADADGAPGCHSIHGCSGACPKGLDPAAAIRRLRRWSLRAA
jgi:succinate dehydrogenase/fumarate reductase iron-sulfur protein